jgi:kelch-like protein 2/3
LSYQLCMGGVAGVGVLDGLLYAVGGHDGPLVRKSVEYFSPESGVWTQTSDMHMCRRNAGIYNSMLVVIICNA